MQAFRDFWKGFRLLPSAWLLIVQFFILILSSISHDSHISYRAISWVLGALALLLIAKVIRQSPAFTALGLFFVSGALLFSILILLGYREPAIQITAHIFESLAYFYAAYGLLRYMFADRYLTKDEMFAAGAVFTLLAWGWLDILFLSFSLQSATGLSDIVPSGAAARVIAIIQMFGGVMYLAVIVTRLVALQYTRHSPKD